mmetsp:Transcript_123921/g.174804  ORF Transcript_123921/g.174804 Transcript_123921/m.174804 type:complete len:216 (-) Transcript_123921:63-710(-)
MPWKPPATKKCPICEKSVYAAEEVKVVVNKEEMSYHKTCFKCIDCGLKLELNTYRVSDFGDPEVFCQKCVPKQAPSQTADTVETRRNMHATALFKDVGIVNEQVRGSEETVGKGMSGAASAEIERSKKASSLARDVGLVNEQVRVDDKTYETMTRRRDGGDVVQAEPNTYVNRRSAIVSVESVAEGLMKKVRLHKLDLEEIIAKTRELLAAAEAE